MKSIRRIETQIARITILMWIMELIIALGAFAFIGWAGALETDTLGILDTFIREIITALIVWGAFTLHNWLEDRREMLYEIINNRIKRIIREQIQAQSIEKSRRI